MLSSHVPVLPDYWLHLGLVNIQLNRFVILLWHPLYEACLVSMDILSQMHGLSNVKQGMTKAAFLWGDLDQDQ